MRTTEADSCWETFVSIYIVIGLLSLLLFQSISLSLFLVQPIFLSLSVYLSFSYFFVSFTFYHLWHFLSFLSFLLFISQPQLQYLLRRQIEHKTWIRIVGRALHTVLRGRSNVHDLPLSLLDAGWTLTVEIETLLLQVNMCETIRVGQILTRRVLTTWTIVFFFFYLSTKILSITFEMCSGLITEAKHFGPI